MEHFIIWITFITVWLFGTNYAWDKSRGAWAVGVILISGLIFWAFFISYFVWLRKD